MSNWLDELKVGDKIAIPPNYFYGGKYEIRTVKKLTKTLIITAGYNEINAEVKFRKADGYQLGSRGYYRESIVEYTQEVVDANKLVTAKKNLDDVVEKLTGMKKNITSKGIDTINDIIMQLLIIIDEMEEK